jgi:galactose oxidase
MTRVDILDFNNSKSSISPTLRQVDSTIKHGRKMQTAVILPKGKLVVSGGTRRDNIDSPIYVPEMFDPTTESWQALPPATTPKMSNHISLLLLDDRVWIAGGSGTNSSSISSNNNDNNNKSLEMQTEIFSPDYVFEKRPTITGIPRMEGGYG